MAALSAPASFTPKPDIARRNRSSADTCVVLMRTSVYMSRPSWDHSRSTSVVLPAPTSPVTMTKPSPCASPKVRCAMARLCTLLPKKNRLSGVCWNGEAVKP